VRAHAAYVPQCSDSQFSATRDPSNPLELPTAPGSNPLSGAHLFIDGPRHGDAAGAIAQLLGLDPTSYADNYSWAQFQQDISPGGSLYYKLAGNPSLQHQVALLELIGNQQETQNISLYSQGGGPGAIYSQVQKILCHNLTADPNPNTVPVFSTFLIYPNGRFCPSLGDINGNWSTFKRQVDELAAGTGRHPAVFLLEIDAVGTSLCLSPSELEAWEADLRYEIETLTALPHTVVYVEGGAADEDSPQYVAKVLSQICVVNRGGKSVNVCALMRGFYTNGTHFDWSNSEINWANHVVVLLRNRIRNATGVPYTAHFVVNTAQNGQGPMLNPHPVQQGIEDLCNPPGRGLGRAPTAQTNATYDGHSFLLTDAFLWTGVPGRSHNSNCHPGDAPAGVFDPRFAMELASNASDQLGPMPVVGPPPPVLGQSVDASVVSGIILVKLPHPASDVASAASSGYVPLSQARALPVGTQVDSLQGTLRLTAATEKRGQTQTGIFGGGLFKLGQVSRGANTGLTTLSMFEGGFPGIRTYASCKAKKSTDPSSPVASAALSSSVLQTLHASAHGRFRTRGRYSAATVRGTVWTTIDRCDGTLVTVQRDTVAVTDFVRHKTVLVHAGHSYFAKAPTKGKK
jgi:hypothetical protein